MINSVERSIRAAIDEKTVDERERQQFEPSSSTKHAPDQNRQHLSRRE